MTSELKPCPFCGGEAEHILDNIYSNDPKRIHATWVQCTKCGSDGKHIVDRHDNDHRSEAIKAWNTRTQPPALSEPKEEWRDIESAPKDGTEIWGYWEHLPNKWQGVVKAFFDDGEDLIWLGNDWGSINATPTHWMPLPNPPNAQREDK